MLYHFFFFFFSPATFFLSMLNCLRIFHCLVVGPRSPLGRYFGAWHPFSIRSGSLLSLLLLRSLVCCPLADLLSCSFLRCLLSVGCRLLTGFRLASYRGVAMGCKAPHLRSICPKFPDGFCTLLMFYMHLHMHLHIRSFTVGLRHGIPVPPLLLRRRCSLVDEE